MQKATDDKGDLSEYLRHYEYQRALTGVLDSIGPDPFDQALIDKIVLWKVNRYAPLTPKALELLNSVVQIKPGSHRLARTVITALLEEHGVDLAMGSAFLRFRNPRTFQIIDRHAYRAVYGEDYRPPSGKDEVKAKVDLYLQYLDDLVELARSKDLEFATLDRVLYMFDKENNPKL